MQRKAGVLLHITSLPGRFGIGDLGPEAYEFVNFLKASKQTYWQVLPINPTGYAESPYQAFSGFAGNPYLISPERLVQMGLISEDMLEHTPEFSDTEVYYEQVKEFKNSLFEKAFIKAKEEGILTSKAFEEFQKEESTWLQTFCVFMAIKETHEFNSWLTWPEEARKYTKELEETYAKNKKERVEYYMFLQYLFFLQWKELKSYANMNDIKIIGDIPIFVSEDSADVWSNTQYFQFSEEGYPTVVAGVPPDYFSATGQLWGNPHYAWEAHEKDNFAWWKERFKGALSLYDYVRVDHFIGFVHYYAIPYGSETAEHGEKRTALGRELFTALRETFGDIPMIAEDLGTLTEDVIRLRDDFNFPGMKILQFAFDDGDAGNDLPHLWQPHCAAYTGTHDNDTVMGWFNGASKEAQDFALSYMQKREDEGIFYTFLRTLYHSAADTAIAPMQDILGQGTEARMNIPGTVGGNWLYRVEKKELSERVIIMLSDLVKSSHRE